MAAPSQPRSHFIISPWVDYICLIFSPVLALLIGICISGTELADSDITLLGHEETITEMFIGCFIMAHIFIVFFRSHGNAEVFNRHPYRFTIVPLALLGAMTISQWIAVTVIVVATWWDVYHSSLQTFGIGRLYDMRRGNHPQLGRKLDMGLNFLLYAGPILGGATLVHHVDTFEEYEEVGSTFFTAIPAYADLHSQYLTWGIVAIGVPFLLFYLFSYYRMHRQGYQVSLQKVLLLTLTGVTSIFTWGFNTFGEAFFIMNFFHALQYFALVWWTEGNNITRRLGLDLLSYGKAIAFLVLLSVGFAYGFWAEFFANYDLALNLSLVISIMHFWYDGFIWSVRKKQVVVT